MALSALNQYELIYESQQFFNRFLGERFKVAIAIIAEDPSTTNHADRIVWAKIVAGDPKINQIHDYGLVLTWWNIVNKSDPETEVTDQILNDAISGNLTDFADYP